jgi:hypothetical protein
MLVHLVTQILAPGIVPLFVFVYRVAFHYERF